MAVRAHGPGAGPLVRARHGPAARLRIVSDGQMAAAVDAAFLSQDESARNPRQ